MLSAGRRQPHLLHVSAVDRRQTWSMDKSWRCVTLSGFLHSHIVCCRWNPISCATHYSGPDLSENDSARSVHMQLEDRRLRLRHCLPIYQHIGNSLVQTLCTTGYLFGGSGDIVTETGRHNSMVLVSVATFGEHRVGRQRYTTPSCTWHGSEHTDTGRDIHTQF